MRSQKRFQFTRLKKSQTELGNEIATKAANLMRQIGPT
jgi:hypothetical protein